VEADVAFRRLRLEVGRSVTNLKSHLFLLPRNTRRPQGRYSTPASDAGRGDHLRLGEQNLASGIRRADPLDGDPTDGSA
jgi:hypothetical protein